MKFGSSKFVCLMCVCVEQTPSVRWGVRAATHAIYAVVVIAHFDSTILTCCTSFCSYQLVTSPVPPPLSCTREKRHFLVLMAQIYTIIRACWKTTSLCQHNFFVIRYDRKFTSKCLITPLLWHHNSLYSDIVQQGVVIMWTVLLPSVTAIKTKIRP